MTPEQFEDIGRTLCGAAKQWQGTFSKEIAVSRRSARYYAEGTLEVPEEVQSRILEVLRLRVAVFTRLIEEMESADTRTQD